MCGCNFSLDILNMFCGQQSVNYRDLGKAPTADSNYNIAVKIFYSIPHFHVMFRDRLYHYIHVCKCYLNGVGGKF